ncbi:MAG: Ku protein [Acidisphaera sp.]|nr:Ku protein [Acidisphaera sp.]
MADRPIWRGHLRLALVSCPVALYTAKHERNNLHFHFINPETGNRVRMITLDAETDKEVSRRELVRGYEFKKDNYLIMSNEDFESARIESSSTVGIDKFVPADSINPVYFDASYYMVPDGDAGKDVFVVLRDAIAQTGRMALSRVVMARRERAVAIEPLERGLVVHTLHEAKDLNDWNKLFDRIPDEKPDPDMVKLAVQLIDRQTGTYDPADMEDRYEARLREVIDAKLRGEGIAPEQEEEADRSNVIDLMAALKNSLDKIGSAPPKPAAKPAKAAAAKPKSKPRPEPSAKEPARKPAQRKRA